MGPTLFRPFSVAVARIVLGGSPLHHLQMLCFYPLIFP